MVGLFLFLFKYLLVFTVFTTFTVFTLIQWWRCVIFGGQAQAARGCQRLPAHFLFPLSQYFTHSLQIWPDRKYLSPPIWFNGIYLIRPHPIWSDKIWLTDFFVSIFIDTSSARYCVTFSGWIVIVFGVCNCICICLLVLHQPGIVSPYQDWSGWIGTLLGFLLSLEGRRRRFLLEYPGRPSFFPQVFCHCLQLAPIKTIMPSFSSTAPAFVFAAERFCPNYFGLPLLHQQYNTICRRSHFRFRNLFIIVSKSYPLTFNFPYQLLLQKLIFNLFSLFSFLSCFTCEGAFHNFHWDQE